MYLFFKKCLIISLYFLLTLSILIFFSVFFKYDHKNDYPAAMFDKISRLDNLKEKRKLIICGGSSSSYSINSKRLEVEFNRNVINTSLAMTIGSKFQLNLTKKYLKKGDVVLYFPEYESYYSNIGGGDILYSLFFYYPSIWYNFDIKEKFLFLVKSPKLTINCLKNILFKRNSDPITQYSRKAYNRLGDNNFLINNNESTFSRNVSSRYNRLKSKKINDKFVNNLIEFNNFCNKKGVIFLFGFPPLAVNDFDDNFSIDSRKILKKTNLKFIGLPYKNVFADSLFYDTSYHMNGLGRNIRTQILVENLLTERIFK